LPANERINMCIGFLCTEHANKTSNNCEFYNINNFILLEAGIVYPTLLNTRPTPFFTRSLPAGYGGGLSQIDCGCRGLGQPQVWFDKSSGTYLHQGMEIKILSKKILFVFCALLTDRLCRTSWSYYF
jgi:hypothetical protein